ncbi:MAG: chemotaxis protein CheX [Candidatus Schekmanbacteria bacterium]|nr:chemotaxis protein CheX [Candidatus Schekmanbacteria bacterium]
MVGKFFGEFLLERSVIDAAQLRRAVALQGRVNLKLGTIALDRGLLSAAQIAAIRAAQRSADRRFGELAVDLGLLTPEQLEALLDAQQSDRVHLGEALLQVGAVTEAQLETELAAFKAQEKRATDEYRQALGRLPHGDLVATFVESAVDMMVRLAAIQAKVRGVRREALMPAADDLVIAQTADVGEEVAYACSFPANLAAAIASAMEASPPAEIAAYVVDVIAEFVNILVGNAVVRARERGRPCAPPEVLAGPGPGEGSGVPAPARDAEIVTLATTVEPCRLAVWAAGNGARRREQA